jgi:hypothetical protein
MDNEQAKAIMSGLIDQAISSDNRGDVTMRNQTLRNIQELSLSSRYVRLEMKKCGLFDLYKKV